MRTSSKIRFSARQVEVRSHLYSVGQAVRRKDSFGHRSASVDVFRVTARLPESGGSPQYRIRSEEERHERVILEENLEAIEGAFLSPETTLRTSPLNVLFGPASTTSKG
jgi:hypothetical protein